MFRELISIEYTTSQQEAIDHINGNLQLIACAGSGKTQVVSERIINILRRKKSIGIQPGNIVAFTFTDKAAAELKDRIGELFESAFGDRKGLAEMYVGTIHGFCLDILQTYVFQFLKFTVLNDVQQKLLVDRASNKTGLSEIEVNGKPLRRYVDTALFLQALSIVQEAEINHHALEGHAIWRALEKYREYLQEKCYLDYTAIIGSVVYALENNEELRHIIAERIKYITVDEYQDVNPIQERLVQILHELGSNVCVVGDDDQTIYQWRGSDIQNMLTFANRYPDVKQIKLEENFRSSPGVVEFAQEVIELNRNRLSKKMISEEKQRFEEGDIAHLEFNTERAEANFIANTIEELKGIAFRDKDNEPERGLSYSDMAILLRSVRKSGQPIITALEQEGIPFIVKGMNNLFNTLEARAAAAIFHYMVDSITKNELRDAWINADIGITPSDIELGISTLDTLKKWDNERWATYNLQRTLLRFLEEISLREERVPNDRGEIIFYNLGKFSEVISDFEQINFHSEPQHKYTSFSQFLIHKAPNYYSEGWQSKGHSSPDAIQIMTIHQAKGMEFPVVFVPALTDNLFPPRKPGGRNIWHIIPQNAVINSERFEGDIEDERRLFYVAITRSKKFIFLTRAPHYMEKSTYRKRSPFFDESIETQYTINSRPDLISRPHLPPQPKKRSLNVALNFSELKYYYLCPYSFKLRILYGFNPPIHEALGYGRSLHNILAEIHQRAINGEIVEESQLPEIIDRHLHLSFAYPQLKELLYTSAQQVIKKYVRDNRADFDKIEYAEKTIELTLGDGVVVNGRIDLIRRTDTKEIIVIDFKSSDRAQAEDITREQLNIYALGYEQLTGERADLIQIYELDKGKSSSVLINDALINATRLSINDATNSLHSNCFEKKGKCETCDLRPLCKKKE